MFSHVIDQNTIPVTGWQTYHLNQYLQIDEKISKICYGNPGDKGITTLKILFKKINVC